MAGMANDLANFLCQGAGHPLVGVDLEYPLARTGLDAGVAPGPFDLPGAFDEVIGHRWGTREISAQERALESRQPETDPLHAFPVAGVNYGNDCGSGSGCSPTCGENVTFVSLSTTFPAKQKSVVP